jgi:hypothetical protein
MAAALVPMVAVTIWLAATGEHVEHPTATGLYWGYLVGARADRALLVVASPGEQVRAAPRDVRNRGVDGVVAVL